MITYKELRQLIRFKEKDNNEIRFSDYDIKMAVNECIRYFNNSLALQSSDFLEKAVTYSEEDMNNEVAAANEDLPEDEKLPFYDFKEDGIELPEDFISLVSVMVLKDGTMMSPVESIRTPMPWQYKVVGNRLYSGARGFKIVYRAAIAEIKDEEDVIELPVIFKDSLAKVSSMILNNNASTDVMMQAVNDAVAQLVPRRRYRNAKIKMPFRVGWRYW